MSQPICPIEEDEESRAKRALAWKDVYVPFANDAFIRRESLSPQAVDFLNRTEHAAKMSLAQTDLSPSMRKLKPTTRAPVANAVAAAASSIARPPPIRSLFDLSSSMQHNAKDLQSFRKEIGPKLEQLDAETLKVLNEVCNEMKDAELPSLAKNYLAVILSLHQSVEEVIADCASHLSGQTERDLKEMQRLREEKIKAIEEHIRSLSSQQSWSALAKVTKYLTFTATILLSSEVTGLASYFLFASGALGLVNTAAVDLSVWKGIAAYFTKSQEVQNKVARDIDLLLTLCSIGFGFIGGVEAYGARAFDLAKDASRDVTLAKAKDIIIWFTAIFTTISFAGRNWSEKKLNTVQANLEATETKLTLLREQFKLKSAQTSQIYKMAQVITEETARILASSEVNLN